MALHFSAFRILAVAASAAVLLSAHPQAEAKTMGPTAAAIAGGVAGLAIGAAIADANRHKAKKYHYNGYVPPYQPGGYDPYFDRAFRPSNDVTCYPAQRLCYNDNGSVAKNWSRRVFGY
jgi:hypothetical protein